MSETDVAHLVDRFMRRISARVHGRAVQVDTDRIGPMGGMILLTLAEAEPLPIHELASRMSRDKSQMTRAVQMLENKGLIDRRGCPDDARVRLLALTEKGHRTVDSFRVILDEAVSEVLAPLEPAEKVRFREMLARILA